MKRLVLLIALFGIGCQTGPSCCEQGGGVFEYALNRLTTRTIEYEVRRFSGESQRDSLGETLQGEAISIAIHWVAEIILPRK